ncbi:MAG: DUF4258 domain-containing protein [Phycisphaeraceae bacterium]|nr:MAG: DUF4258 domain-containing protein [Phycisphaeraceae bacterium]
MSSRINVFRRKVALGHYELTGHAKSEMEQDGFTIEDIKSAIYTGRIAAVQRHGRGRRKDVVHGKGVDGRGIRLVCRLTELGRLRIITVFAARTR